MSTPHTYELGWLSYLSNILSPLAKKWGSKKFLLVRLQNLPSPHFQNRCAAPATRNMIGHFRDQYFQAIDCTGMTINNNETTYHIHPKHKRQTEKTALTNGTIYTLIWHAFYDLWPGNILKVPEPHGAVCRVSLTMIKELIPILKVRGPLPPTGAQT